MKEINLLAFGLAICVLSGCGQQKTTLNEKDIIKPYTENPGYWQYKGQPVLLLGATDNVNLFQISHLESHLDSLKACGGNYIRNGMNDGGPENVRKYAKTADEKYDLNQWNDEYWRRFENTLKLASERDIIVQVEVWDRFNHSRGAWPEDP